MKALSPATVIELRDVLTGATRAGRIRDSTIASWLSTRPGRRAAVADLP
jgi:hypothetical protein